MSLVKNVLKSLKGCSGLSSTAVKLLETTETAAVSVAKPYSKLISPEGGPFRYVVKDKSTYGYSTRQNLALPRVPKNEVENKYFWKKTHIEMKKCFEKIDDIQKRCSLVKRYKNNITPQITYDTDNPNLWKTVRQMYANGNLFVSPQPFH